MAHTILVVDDSRSVRAVIGTTLKMGGYNVITATDGKEALELLKKETEKGVNLIISDINMPEMDGVTFIKEVKKIIRPCIHAHLCFNTETEQSKLEDDLKGLKDSWITKPVQPAHVLNVVGELLQA